MKFTLTSAGRFYTRKAAKKLAGFGFRFKTTDDPLLPGPDGTEYKIAEPSEPITLETLDELLVFAKLHGPLILTIDEDGPEIELYDDYRE